MATSSPLNGETFLAVVTKSMLVDTERLKRAVDDFKAAGGDANHAADLAEHLTAKSLITKWQSEKLLQGKHKGYFLSKYKLLSLLGKGGMSSVFLAEHTLMKRRCAIKVLPHKRVADSSYLARFHREAQAVASLDHPNIVRAYDVDHQDERETVIHFLVMEHVDGLSLQELIAKSGRCSLVDSVDYVRQAAVGLAHAHKAGLVHRDIKPGNLLRDQSGVVKILDLGLARFFDNQGQEESLTIQHDEKVLGTADYLAPEQALDSHTVDARADIYSLGCTLYFLLTGHPPFTEGTLTQRLMAHQTKEPPAVETDRPEIPPSLTAIVRKMMAKKPDDRYATADETAEALRKWLGVSAPEEWKTAHRQLFATDTTRRAAPVMAQVVTPKAAVPVAPPAPPPVAPMVPPPSSKMKMAPPPLPVEPASSSNIFSFGPPAETTAPASTPSADPNLAAFFAGLGESKPTPTKPAPKPEPKSTPVLKKPEKPAPQVPDAPAPKSAVPAKAAKPSSVVKKQTAPSTIVATPSAIASPTGGADFSFLAAAPAAPVAESGNSSGLFDFLGTPAPVAEPTHPPAPVVTVQAPPVLEPPAVVERPPVEEPPVAVETLPEPMFEIGPAVSAPVAAEGLFQFGDFTAPVAAPPPAPAVPVVAAAPEPVVAPAPPVTPPAAKVIAKPVAPLPEPEFHFGPPADTAAVAISPVPSFDFGAPAPISTFVSPVVAESAPVAVAAVSGDLATIEPAAPVGEAPAVPRKKAKAALPPFKLPPALQDRRVQMGIGGGVGVVLLVGLALAFGLFGGGQSKGVTRKSAGKKTTAPVVQKSSSASKSGTASASRAWSGKKSALVGATGDFKTLGEALQTVKQNFKPATRTDRFTIKVAAGNYAERIVLDAKSWPNNIVITGEGGAIVLEPTGADPVIKITGLEGIQISNVVVKAQGKPVAIELGGNLARVHLQKFTVQGFSEAGIHFRGGLGLSFSDARCQIEEGQFEPGSASAVGVKCTAGDGADALDTQNVLLQKLRFLGPMAAGITISGKDPVNLEFRESIFSDTKVGVQIVGKSSWRDFQFVNNTFYKSPNPVLVAEQPEFSSKGVSFRRNLFVECGPEVVVEKGFDEKQLIDKQVLGKNRLNFSTRAKPEGAKNELSIFGDGGQQGNAGLKFASTDGKNGRFLAPADDAPQRNVGGQEADEKPYVGAVAP